jgi:hypothetical protein
MWRLVSVLSLRAVHGGCQWAVFACDNSQQASVRWYVMAEWRVPEQAGTGSDVMAAATTLHVTTGAVLGVALCRPHRACGGRLAGPHLTAVH